MSSSTSLENMKSTALSVYAEVKSFFGSPVFFIALGCLFLVAAFRLMDQTHPSFVFLLAILGVSIVLYGTGTQGVGSADFKNVPIRVAVAGGAGILAGVFGFGIVWQGDKIPEIFKTQQKYGLIRLQNGDKHYDFSKLLISATSFNGTPLHLMTRSNVVQIVMPLTVFESTLEVCVVAIDPTGKRLTEADYCVQATMKEDDETSDNDRVEDGGTKKAGADKVGADKKQDKKAQSANKFKSPERRDFARIYQGVLVLNPDAIPKDDGSVFQPQ